MRMSAQNKAKYDTLIAVLNMSPDEALAVVYPKKAKAPAKPATPSPVDILVESGFTREEAERLVAEKPVAEIAPTPEELRTAAVTEGGFVFGKGRIYLHPALIDAAMNVTPGGFQIVPNEKGHGATLVFNEDGALALQALYAKKDPKGPITQEV